MKYQVFIDETGNFSKKTRVNRNTDFVAGWVCSEEFTYGLKKKLIERLKPSNREIQKTLGKEFIVKIPDHLHFMPLHLAESRTNRDQVIKIPLSKVRPVVSVVFDSILDNVEFVFRSYGFPRYYANEQAAYQEILRATILQLIDEIDYCRDGSIKVTIAARRVKKLMGECGYGNIREYERHLCNTLQKEISDAFPERNISALEIVCGDARKDVDLGIADMFCGALRWEEYDYLKAYKRDRKVKEFNIHKAFVYISNRTVPRIQYLFENDPAMGLMLGFEHLARNSGNEGIGRTVASMCKKLGRDEMRLFGRELDTYLHEKLVEDPHRYQNFDFVNALLDEVEKYISLKHIHGITKKYRIKIFTHRGRTDIGVAEAYLDFLEKDGAEILGGMYPVAQERLETILSIVQPAAFNVFKFEEVEKYLCDEIEKYDRLFPRINSPLDETRACLEGTIGQMYAFFCDYPDGEAFVEDALQHLHKDVGCCSLYSACWYQGMGYLTSFYFKRGAFDNTVKSFLIETRSEKIDKQDIFDLSRLDLFRSRKGDFFLLHRLYLCALGMKNGLDVKGEDTLAKKLLQSEAASRYPVFLTVKWLAVIYAQKDDIQRALELLESIDAGESDDFTIDVIKLPVRMLVHLCRKRLKKSSGFNLEAELDRLENRCPGISDNLCRLGIDATLMNDEAFDYYKIASLMPFYYS